MAVTDDDATVIELMLRWERLRQAGRAPTAEELCEGRPDLADSVRRGIEILRLMGTPPGPTLGPDTPGPQVTAAPSAQAMPPHDGRYQVLGEVARGGMGVVLRALDRTLGRDVALKVMHPEAQRDPGRLRRFVEEAKLTGQLQHPGIPPVHDQGTLPDGGAFYAMKLVKGRTLAALLAGRTGPGADLPRLLATFESACQAVAYAHDKGVIHRDLKPLNFMVGAFGEVQVMDWGLAKLVGRPEAPPGASAEVSTIRDPRGDDPDSATRADTVLGTPAFMPPEQAEGEVARVDRRADVFALGSVLCAILTGEPAYTGRSHAEVLRKARRGDLDEAYARLDACGADGDLVALAKRCLTAEPTDRPEDAGAVARRIADHQAEVAERLRREEIARVEAEARAGEATRRVTVERSRRRRTAALALTALGLVALAVGGWSYLSRQRAARQLATTRAVDEALAQADLAQGRAESLDDPDAELAAWNDVMSQTRRAADALDTGEPTSELRYRVLARLSLAWNRLHAAEVDRRLVSRLEAVRGRRADHRDAAQADREYAEAFREAGVDLDAMDPDGAADWVGRRRAADEIIAGIDDWCAIRRWDLPEGVAKPSWVHLNAIAMRADYDEWRNEVRQWFDRPRVELGEALRSILDDEEETELQPASSLVLLANLYKRAGDPDAAQAVLERHWARHSGDFWINCQLGFASWNSETMKFTNPTDATRYLTAAVAVNPASAAAHCNLGVALSDQGELVAAVAEYREAIRLRPDFALAHNHLGKAMKALGELDEAVAEYREAIRLKPDYALAHFNLGVAQSDQGNLDEAVAEYFEVSRLRPDYFSAHNALGNALSDQGMFNEAVAKCREAIRLRPDDAEAHNALSNALWKQGMLEEAVAEGREAIRLRPDYAVAYCDLGNALRSQGKLDEAVDAFREAVCLEPDLAFAHAALGMALVDQGKVDEAFAESSEAIRIRADKAVAEGREAIRLRPDDAEAHNILGIALRRQGKLDEAVAEGREAIRLEPDFAAAHNAIGIALKAQGKLDEAVAEYREAIRLRPDYSVAQHVLEETLVSQGLYTNGTSLGAKHY
jgi:serine/threonine-protein kinase